MSFIDVQFSFESIATSRLKGFWVYGKGRKRFERVAGNVSYDAKAFGKFCHNRSSFQSDRLVLLFSGEDCQGFLRGGPIVSRNIALRFIEDIERPRTGERRINRSVREGREGEREVRSRGRVYTQRNISKEVRVKRG